MWKVSNNRFYITRGDSAVIPFTATDADGNIYTLTDGLVMTMTVKVSTDVKDHLIQLSTTAGTITYDQATGKGTMIFKPADTASLAYGNYVYDVQINNTDGSIVDTVQTPSLFVIGEEVTF